MPYQKLLYYYHQELTFLRTVSQKFGETHPAIASQLSVKNPIDDPHIARLVEAFALANAKIRCQEMAESTELYQSLQQSLYPYLFSSIPALSVVKFKYADKRSLPLKTIPARTQLRSPDMDGIPCLFQTTYPAQLLDLEVSHASLCRLIPGSMPASAHMCATARLHLTVRSNYTALPISALITDYLRFYIQAPPPYANLLYEWLFSRTTLIALSNSINDPEPLLLDPTCLRAVGFQQDEELLPYPHASSRGTHLLIELLAFPEKFLFFDLTSIKDAVMQKCNGDSTSLEIYFYGQDHNVMLENNITSDFFALGCTPIVNLFTCWAEPIPLTHQQTEYLVVPEAKYSPATQEIHSIKRVFTTVGSSQHQQEYQPLYFKRFFPTAAANYDQSLPLTDNSLFAEKEKYYQMIRKWSDSSTSQAPANNETAVFLRLIDKETNFKTKDTAIIHTETLCSNANLPEKLPFSREISYLSFVSNSENPFITIQCLMPFTAIQRPLRLMQSRSMDCSHLLLNQWSLSQEETGIQALRAILNTCHFIAKEKPLPFLAGILEIKSRRVFKRQPNVKNGDGLCYGNEITLIVDDSKFSGGSLYLFGQVLNHFFSLNTTINSFFSIIVT